MHASTAPLSTGGRWFGAAAAGLFLGLLIGFASGFIVAQRMEPLAAPRSAAEPRVLAAPAEPPQPSAARSDAPQPSAPAAGAPQTFTESSVTEPPAPAAEPSAPAAVVEETPVTRVAPTARRPAVTRTAPVTRSAPAPRPAPVEPAAAQVGSLQVASRPPGAQVYLDDARVGTTPVTIGNVRQGPHRLRIELPGYRPWSTSVDVTGNNPTRIGASLER
jgi:hypothetical protein